MGFVSRFSLALSLVLGALAVMPQALRADQPVMISGVVVDGQTGGPLSGALVSVGAHFHRQLTTKTDRRGHFSLLAGATTVNYIAAEYPGPMPQGSRFSLTPGTSAQIKLTLYSRGGWGSSFNGPKPTETEFYDRYVVR